MTSDDSVGPPKTAQAGLVPEETSPRIYKENNTDMNQPKPSNPPETPTPPPSGTPNSGTRAQEPMSLSEMQQKTFHRIRTLEIHNGKLFEDNSRLINAVNMLNDRLAFFGAPQNIQVLRLADMQEKLRVSEANWASINRKYQELLQSIPAGSAQHHIGMELQAIRDAYALLDREYRLLGDKYLRLKAVTDTSRVAQQQSQGGAPAPVPHIARGHIPVAPPEFANATQSRVYAHDQSRKNTASPTSVITHGSFQPSLDQRGNHRRRSSESVMALPSLRTGPTPGPIATTWLASLPTPPPSTPLLGGQISPQGFPVHAPVPAGFLPLPHHSQMIHNPRSFSELSAVTQSRHLVEQGTSEQLKAADRFRRRSGENTYTVTNELVPCDYPAPAPLKSSPRPQKRPSSELQTSTSPEGEHKKPRIEGEVDRPTTIKADTYPADEVLSPVASADLHNDRKLSMSGSDVRSYQDCVNVIFEKDADVENGVFCGLCLDRYEAKMIQEPPDVLVQPDFDSLVMHCMTMHPTVWDDLRRKA